MCSPKLFYCMHFTINVSLIIVYLGYLLFQLPHVYIFYVCHPWREETKHKTEMESKVKPQKH